LIQDGTTYKKKIIIFAFMKKFQTMKQKTKLKIPSYKHSRWKISKNKTFCSVKSML